MSNYAKLKTNLKLAIQRLKLLEKKKTELSLKSRKEIADYIALNKADRARIRVEHIIREDNFVEAMEMLEMFIDLLLARFGLIEKMKELDPGLDQAIATILWAAPRISNDIQEFKIISEIFAHKYGKKYADACKIDSLNNVNEKVKKRLGLEAPPKLLVEQYLIEIAKNFNVEYEPDREVMTRSGIIDEPLINLQDQLSGILSRNENNNNNNNNGTNGGGNGGQSSGAMASAPAPLGFDHNNNPDLIDLINEGNGHKVPPPPSSMPYGEVRPQPSPPPHYNNTSSSFFNGYGNLSSNSGGGGGGGGARANARLEFSDDEGDADYLALSNNDRKNFNNVPSENEKHSNAPPLPGKPGLDSSSAAPHNAAMFQTPPPSYYGGNQPTAPAAQWNNVEPGAKAPPPFRMGQDDDDFELPSVPTHNDEPAGSKPGGSGGDMNASIDFDDLQKRFFNLKSSK